LDIRVAHRAARKLGRSHVTLSELDESSWTRFDDKSCRELGKLVVSATAARIQSLPKEVLERALPAPEGASFDDLPIEVRTLNCLKKLKRSGTITNPEDLRNVTISEILGIRALGAKSLVDLLAALETASAQNQSYTYTREGVQTTRAKKSLDAVLTREALKIQSSAFAGLVRIDDPRLGKYLRSLVRSAARISRGWSADERPTLGEIAGRIANRRIDPADPKDLTSEIHTVQQIVSSLSEASLERELRDLAVAVSEPRNTQIMMQYFGWDGRGTTTLQSAGSEFNLTRERVRQIGDQFARHFARKKPFSPASHRALELIHSHLPAPADQIETLLVKNHIAQKQFRLEGLVSAARFLDHQCSFRIETIHGQRFVISRQTPSWAPEIVRAAAGTVRHWGTAFVADVAELVNEAHSLSLTPEYVAGILQTRKDFAWLDPETGHQWFWLSSVPRNRLINRVAKVLSVSPEIHISELSAAVSRTRGLNPPQEVLLEFCRQLSICRVKGQIVSASRPINRERQLSKTEFLMFHVMKKHGPLLEWGRFEALCKAEGINSDAFTVFMANSPIITRYARGVYGLVGSKVSRLVQPFVAKRDSMAAARRLAS
jgi:hypothetical protein